MNSTIILTLAISLILFIVISSSLYDKPPNIQVSFNIVIPQNHTTSNETKIISTISLLLSPSPQPPLPQPPPEEQPVITAPPPRTIKKKTSVEKLEESLARARAAIKEAARTRNIRSEKEEGFVPSGPVYRHPEAFHRSHIEMMKTFKIWTYTEGDLPIFHGGPLNNIYGIEGRFILEMEGEMMSHVDSSRFRAKNPDEAHVFFLPFSVAKMVQFFYRPLVSYSRGPLYRVVLDYVNVVAERYPYWNRSRGADHFMVSCHDWAPEVSDADPELLKNLIRGLCNANISEGFRPNIDVSIPEINIPVGQLGPPDLGVRPSRRQTLAFFAGGAHGHIRRVLFEHWKDKDDEVRVYERLPKNIPYFKLLGESKFCLCPSGYEVASPRIVEAIRAECIPVIISDNYSLPFRDVLDWSQFSISVSVEKIPEIKTILKGVSARKYLRLLRGVRSVKRHFKITRPSEPYDLLHMVIHSIWLRRLDFRLPVDVSSS